MATFFRTPDGRWRAFRICACIYVFNALVSLVAEGWHSLSWIAWFLMALGFSQMETVKGPQTNPPKGFSLGRLVGLAAIAAMLLGASLILYHAFDVWRAR